MNSPVSDPASDPDHEHDNAAQPHVAGILAPAWQARIDDARQGASNRRRVLPRSTQYFQRQINLVDARDKAAAMLDVALQRPLSYIGIHAVFKHTRPGVPMRTIGRQQLYWHDPRSVVPLAIGLAMVDAHDDGLGRRLVAPSGGVCRQFSCPFRWFLIGWVVGVLSLKRPSAALVPRAEVEAAPSDAHRGN